MERRVYMDDKAKVWKGLRAYLGHIWKEEKTIYFMGILFFPAYITGNFLQVYLPKMVVKELEEGQDIMYLGISLLVFVMVLMACIVVKVKMQMRIRYANRSVVQKMQNLYSQKMLYVDYKYLEDNEFLSIRNKVKESLFGSNINDERESAGLSDFMDALIELIAVTGNLLLYVYYLCRLSPVLIIILVIAPLVVFMLEKTVIKHETENSAKEADTWQKLDYITRKTEDFSMAKDVRLYQMDGWLSGMIDYYCKKRLKYKAIELRARGFVSVVSCITFGIYNAFFFACVLYRLHEGTISISDVIFYAGMGPALYNLLDMGFVTDIRKLFQISIKFIRFQEYMGYGENTGNKDIPVNKEAPLITLEHVSFSYPGSQKEVLKNLDFTIKKGEKIAIVGVNGAGKTTLMKLICGLLHPSSGRILLNGRDMETMEAEERYSWFSCAFQDIQFLPLSIRENISMDLPVQSDQKVLECLENAGIREEIESLPDGLDTLMEKTLNENAVDFSGGQRQKLILARALYRDAGVLVLDEPAAALDALAENDIYEKYSKFASNKTSFFVSHRLSSTRFCDRILLINGGVIEEEGTHEELVLAGGLYSEMFKMQSKYYKEEPDWKEGI